MLLFIKGLDRTRLGDEISMKMTALLILKPDMLGSIVNMVNHFSVNGEHCNVALSFTVVKLSVLSHFFHSCNSFTQEFKSIL